MNANHPGAAWTPPEKIHFIGAGGAGMAPLAGIVLELGCRVSGSDLLDNGKCRALRAQGCAIATGHRAENLPGDAQAVVYSSAVAPDNPELLAARSHALPAWRRGEFLSLLARRFRRPVAVAGAHGKTSVTALLSWILRRNAVPAGFMIGGELCGDFANHAAGDGDIFVTEADESDGTFALLSGELAVIPNIDDDHAWDEAARRKLEEQFFHFAAAFRQVLYYDAPVARRILGALPRAGAIAPATVETLGLPARFVGFERANAALAVQAVLRLGVSIGDAVEALRDFPGVARRMTEHARSSDGRWIVVEDYAHHPAELEASLTALRLRYPGRRLLVIFQPHRYQRLTRYFERFAALLAERTDQVWLPPVFAAWSESGSCDSAALAARINALGGRALAVAADYPALAAAVKLAADASPEPAVAAVIGAGDVNAVLPFLVKKPEKNPAGD